MSSGSVGSDEIISGSKIQPLDSGEKFNTPLDQSERGAVGTDANVDHCRIEPMGGKGRHQHPLPHADSQGVIGREGVIAGAKIAPFEGKSHDPQLKSPGLDDELVDVSRVQPLGEIREDIA